MSHEIGYRQIDIPELDRFLEEYRALCERHGVQFSCEEYGYDGGSYVTIVKFKDGGFYLNLDEAGRGIPFIERARAEAERIRDAEYAKKDEAAAAAKRASDLAIERQLLSDGVVLGGKKYKLTPT